jgi:hypothetical protein
VLTIVLWVCAGARERGEECVMESLWVAAGHLQPGQDGVDMGGAAGQRVRVCLRASGPHTGCQDGAVAPFP